MCDACVGREFVLTDECNNAYHVLHVYVEGGLGARGSVLCGEGMLLIRFPVNEL